ncbi:MAG: metallophosphoesterase, partial [Muribaculaceae bacterium]|nr:metallophosphoesterase [Muribaculaceae bacterium]
MKLSTLTAAVTTALMITAIPLTAQELVIIHTNDTHSQIDPDEDGLGGIGRRKVVIDSIREAHDNVLLIDAGDAVQGTLYFNIFGGKVEQRLMNELGYDMRILGNHEFDNGVDSLAAVLSEAKAHFIATNYNLDDSPLEDIFEKYEIREIDDHKVGFIGINLRPAGMISEGNYDGVEYLDAVEAANATAWWLRNIEGCDLVVAITHIGYNPVTPPGDLMLAANSSNIDIFIGGHSHDLILPGNQYYQHRVLNAAGKEVLVTQVGKAGKNVGEIVIDLDSKEAEYKVIPIDKRLDDRVPLEIKDMIKPYRTGV